MRPRDEPGRIRALDGLRGLAIALVLAWHYVGAHLPDTSEAARVASKWLGLTWSGVDLFFVLSGFLLGGILLDNTASSRLFRVFYARRACRILPLYATLLVTYFAARLAWPYLHFLFETGIPTWTYLVFVQNYAMARAGAVDLNWLSATWSLAIEEQFYLVLPLIIRLTPRRILPWFFVVLIVTAPIFRVQSDNWLVAFLWLPSRWDSLFLGALVAWVMRNTRLRQRIAAAPTRLTALLVVFVMGNAGMIVALWNHQRRFFHAPLAMWIGYTWIALTYALLITVAVTEASPWISRAFDNSPFRYLGRISFSIYLWHGPVLALAHVYFLERQPGLRHLSQVGVTVVAFVATILLSEVSYRVIERPMMALGHRLRY